MDKFLNTLKRNSSYSINDNNDDGELHKIGQHLYSTDNDNSNEESMDFSDKGTVGKVDIVQNNEGSVTFVHQHDDYYYRPTSIYFLNYLEFVCLFERVSRMKDIKKQSWRLCNLTTFFKRITQCLRQSA